MLLSQGNFDHGSYKSGDRLEAKRDVFERFLSFKGEAYFESFQESVAADRGEYFDGNFDFADCMQDWMQSRALKNRGLYATRLIIVYCGG